MDNINQWTNWKLTLKCIILDIYWKLTFLDTIVEGGQKIDKLEVNCSWTKLDII